MPRTLTRLLTVALLALVVPLQGMAAITAGQCMALGHHDMGQLDQAHGDDHHPDGDRHHGSDGKGATDAHCPPCVSCCAAAAITSSSRVLVLEGAGFAAISVPAPLFSGVTPERLDRPPLPL